MTDRRIPAATVRKAWLDPALTTAEAARAVGLSRSNLWRRAVALGLPERPRGRRAVLGGELFAAMWEAGVTSAEIAAHFGVAVPSVTGAARRLGLPRRPLGWRPRVTLADFAAARLGQAMAGRAAAENRALKEECR